MKKFLFLPFILLSTILVAQDLEKVNKKVEDKWVGTIMLNDGETLQCEFTYNPLLPGGLLIGKTDSMTNIYTPENVLSFSFYDSNGESKRFFYSLPFSAGERDKHFFELVHESEQISILGSNTIVNKSKYTPKNDAAHFMYTVGQLRNPNANKVRKTSVKKTYIHYLLDHRNNSISNFSEGELLRLVDDRIDLVNLFIKDKNIDLRKEKLEDFKAVVDYYSALKFIR